VSTKRKTKLSLVFALEDKKLRERAERKLKEKNLDMIIANAPAAIDAEKSTVAIKIQKGGWTKMENAGKTTIAKRVISLIESIHT